MQPATEIVSGFSMVTLVTEAVDWLMTGKPAKFPAVLVTLAATQQEVPGAFGGVIYHHVLELFLPVIGAG